MGGPLAVGSWVVVATAAVGALVVGARVSERGDQPAGEPFVAVALSAGLAGLVLAVPPLVGVDSRVLLRSYPPLYLLPLPWAVFVLEYVGYTAVRSRRVLAALAGPPAYGVAFNLIAWDLEVSGMAFTVLSVGNLLALLSVLVAGGLVVGSTALLLWAARRGAPLDGRTVVPLVVGGTGPWLAVVAGLQADSWVEAGVMSSTTPPAILATGFVVGVAALATAARRRPLFDELPAPGTVGPDVVFEQLDEPVVVLDRRERIVRLNPAARATFRGDADRMGRELADVLGVDLTTLRSDPRLELVVGGERREFEHGVTDLTDGHDRVVGHAVVLHDVTDREGRKRRIAELQRVRDELERKNQRLDEFATVVSHDLRNPLMVAQGYVRTAVDDGDVSELDRAEDALDRMEQLLDDLLALARAGVDQGDTAPVHLGRAARSAWETAATDGARLEVHEDLPTVEADDSTLRRALENLFRNAADHAVAPDAGDPVTVTVGALPDGFYVADDGQGLPAGERDRVFEHGYTDSDDGTGFGLSIVRETVEAHGWNIEAGESEVGGARFEVTGVDRV